jgi:hypothetical protein
MPSPFPDDVFEAIKDRILSKVPSAWSEWERLSGSHNCVRYRLRASADCSEEFTQSIQSCGGYPARTDAKSASSCSIGIAVHLRRKISFEKPP